MSTLDLINGLFEVLAGLMVLNHCRVLYADKVVRGVSVATTVFFTAWGIWNLFYYPALGQPWSFAGGLVMVAANALYVGMLLHYTDRLRPVRTHLLAARWYIGCLLGRIACAFRGHHYDTPVFRDNLLYFCTRCGREIAGRTWKDWKNLRPMSDGEIDEMHREVDWSMAEKAQ